MKTEIFIQAALRETVTKASGLKLVLTGGVAVAFYTGTIRPLSMEADILILPNEKQEWEKRFNIKFKTNKAGKGFQSQNIDYQTTEKTNVNIILKQLISPDPKKVSKMKVEMAIDDFLMAKTQKKFQWGIWMYVLPPEMLVFLKLLAARNEEEKKYDLLDCEKLMKKEKINDIFFMECVKHFTSQDKRLYTSVCVRLRDSLKKIKFKDRGKLLRKLK